MISKSWQTRLRALQQKKYRHEYGLFFVEGAKNTLELLASDFEVEMIFATETFCKENEQLLALQTHRLEKATPDELTRAGTFQTNTAALAVARTKTISELAPEANEWILVLDDLRDPGNLGTILRVADWYGLTKIICSETTADFYNPKVLAATMGSFTRVAVWYGELDAYFQRHSGLPSGRPVFGTFLNGQNLHQTHFPTSGYLVIGNESNGIGPEVEPFISQKITIPRFGNAESLNAGVATAVVLDNLVRSQKSGV